MTGSPGAPSPASSDRDIKPTTPKLAASPLRRHAAICQLASQRALSSSAIWRCALSRKAWRRSTISTGSSPKAAARAESKAPGSYDIFLREHEAGYCRVEKTSFQNEKNRIHNHTDGREQHRRPTKQHT